jgi:uncharacterized protein (UPF0332 family)
LILTARKLASASRLKPRQADLRRSVSTAYYALFDVLARSGADLLVGTGATRPIQAWAHVYRALDHGFSKNVCKEARNLGFPPEIRGCANEFVVLQEVRHKADYDPTARFTRAEALDWVSRTEAAIASLRAASRRERKAFAVQLLLKRRT